jgi:prepilin-type N-terminal cleavage/methylation domain-containing protein
VSGNRPLRRSQSGFTLVELMVAVSVMAVIGVALIAIVSHYFVVITRAYELSSMTINSQNLLRSTVENIRFGDGVQQTNQINDPNAPSGGWNTSETNFVIVLEVPALNASGNYIIDSDTGSPYMNELVYYKSGSTLLERKLANPGASGDTLLTTCPSNLANPGCPADTQLAQYVSSMVFTLYDQNGNTTTSPDQARSINITLTMQRDVPGAPLTLTNSLRVTLRNRF